MTLSDSRRGGGSTVLRGLAAPATVVVGATAGCVVLWFADPTTPGGVIPVCPTKALLGIDCPGCGSARMIYSLLHGDVTAAVRYNAVALVALALVMVSLASWAAHRVTGRWHLRWDRWRFAPAAVLVVTVSWFVLRNLPFAPFTGLRV